MESTLECNFCKNVFSSKGNLKEHLKKAKYCAKLRGKVIDSKIDGVACVYCSKEFYSNKTLSNHLHKCKEVMLDQYKSSCEGQLCEIKTLKHRIEKLKATILDIESKKDKRIKELEDRLERIASKATITNQYVIKNERDVINIVRGYEPITDADFKACADNLTLRHVIDGPVGHAQLALEYAIKNRAICVDLSRCKLHYKNELGQVVTDTNMTQFSQRYCEAVKEKILL